MKKVILVFVSLLILVTNVFAAGVTVEDNEMGWVNNEIRFNDVDWLNNSVYTAAGETEPYDIDGDSFSLAWNYSLNALVNSKEYDYIEKNLVEPVIGGTFSMSVWIRNNQGVDSDGYKFEVVAFEPNGTEHVLTKTDTLSVSGDKPSSPEDENWHKVSASLPSDKKIIKLGIKMFNGKESKTCWGVINIDGIKITDTQIGEYVRIEETNWIPTERETETPTVVNGTVGYYYEGNEVIVLSGGVTPDLEYLKSIAMSKTLDEPIKNGFLEYKVYMDAFNSSLDNSSHTRTVCYVYDADNNVYKLEGETRIKYGAFLGGGTVYGGWNQFRAELPKDVEVAKIEIAIEWYENGGMGALPYYIDDIKFMTNDVPQVDEGDTEDESENPPTGDVAPYLALVVISMAFVSVIGFKKRYGYR